MNLPVASSWLRGLLRLVEVCRLLVVASCLLRGLFRGRVCPVLQLAHDEVELVLVVLGQRARAWLGLGSGLRLGLGLRSG